MTIHTKAPQRTDMEVSKIEELFGPKCDTYEKNCPTCEVYKAIEEAHQAGADVKV